MRKFWLFVCVMFVFTSVCPSYVFSADGYTVVRQSGCDGIDDGIDDVKKTSLDISAASDIIADDKVIAAKGTFSGTSTTSDKDYLEFSVNDNLNSGNYDYAIVEFDALLKGEKNSLAVTFNIPSKSNNICKAYIENAENAKNVWSGYNGGLRTNAFVTGGEWHKIAVAIPMYGDNITDSSTKILKDEYKNVRIFVDGKEGKYGPKIIELPTIAKPLTVFKANAGIRIGFDTQGTTTTNYETYINNVSIKGYVGAKLEYDKDDPTPDPDPDPEPEPSTETEEIVSNDDFMSGRTLSDIESAALEGKVFEKALSGGQIEYALTDAQKSKISDGDVMILEAYVRTKDKGGKIAFDVIGADGKSYMQNDSNDLYIDESDNGKNLYYITSSWSRISMPYISGADESTLKIDTDENTYIASVTLSKPVEKQLDAAGKTVINDFIMYEKSGMYDLSGAAENVLTKTFDSSITAVCDTVLSPDGKYLYTVGGGALYISSLEDPENPKVIGKINNLGALRQIAIPEKNPDLLVVTGRQCGVTLIDIYDKTNPKKAAKYDSIEYATGLCIWGDYMFVADRVFGVEIVDISDFTNVTEESKKDGTAYKNALSKQLAIARCGEAQSCRVYDGILYAGLWGEHRIDMFDLRNDISNPVKIAEIKLSGKGDGMAVSVKDSKTYLYAATGHHTGTYPGGTDTRANLQAGQGNGFDIFDVTDIVANGKNGKAEYLSTVRADGRFSYSLYDYWSVKYAQNNGREYIYFGSSLNGFYIYDVTDKTAPKRLSHTVMNVKGGTKLTSGLIPYDQTEYTRSPVCGFDTLDGYIYIGGTVSGVYVQKDSLAYRAEYETCDISPAVTDSFYNLSLPEGIGDTVFYRKSDEQFQSARVYAKDGAEYIFAACGTGGIKVFDTNLNVLYTYPSKDITSDIYIAGNTLYAADGQAGLRFFAIGDDAHLTEIGKAYNYEGASSPIKQVVVTSDGKWAVMQAGLRMQIANVSDVNNPKFAAKPSATVYTRQIMDGFVKDTDADGNEYDRFAVVYGHTKAGVLIDFAQDTPKITQFGSVAAAGINGGLSVAKDGKTVIASGVGSAATRYLIVDGYKDFNNISSSYKIPWTNRVQKTDGDNLPQNMVGKSYINGDIMTVSDMIGGTVSMIDISDIENPKALAWFKANGTPNISYASDSCIILTLGYQGIVKINLDKSDDIRFAKSGINIANENGALSAAANNFSDNTARVIAARYTQDGALESVEFLKDVQPQSKSEVFEINNNGGYTKIFLMGADTIYPLCPGKTIK